MRRINSSSSSNGEALKEFFAKIEDKIGRIGLLQTIQIAESNGIYLTEDILYGSKDEKVRAYISQIDGIARSVYENPDFFKDEIDEIAYDEMENPDQKDPLNEFAEDLKLLGYD